MIETQSLKIINKIRKEQQKSNILLLTFYDEIVESYIRHHEALKEIYQTFKVLSEFSQVYILEKKQI